MSKSGTRKTTIHFNELSKCKKTTFVLLLILTPILFGLFIYLAYFCFNLTETVVAGGQTITNIPPIGLIMGILCACLFAPGTLLGFLWAFNIKHKKEYRIDWTKYFNNEYIEGEEW